MHDYIWFKEDNPDNFAIIIRNVAAIGQIFPRDALRKEFKIYMVDSHEYPMVYQYSEVAEMDRKRLLQMIEDNS